MWQLTWASHRACKAYGSSTTVSTYFHLHTNVNSINFPPLYTRCSHCNCPQTRIDREYTEVWIHASSETPQEYFFSTAQLSLEKIDGLCSQVPCTPLCIYICMNLHFDLVPIFTGVKSLHKVQCNRRAGSWYFSLIRTIWTIFSAGVNQRKTTDFNRNIPHLHQVKTWPFSPSCTTHHVGCHTTLVTEHAAVDENKSNLHVSVPLEKKICFVIISLSFLRKLWESLGTLEHKNSAARILTNFHLLEHWLQVKH